ncbi:MAG: 30S ribosomal protein S16 [Planctomycetes bacterium]|jgi:small subunit ribosomal protein S16|nr:30S ribosomal protein S16 [Planctomycetota bacterium]
MTRIGRKNRPFFRVGVFDVRTRRDGEPVEILGTYDPLGTQGKDSEPVKLDLERVKYWLSVGATPSEVMASILKKAGIPPRPAKGAGRSAKKRAKAVAKGRVRKSKPAAKATTKPAVKG